MRTRFKRGDVIKLTDKAKLSKKYKNFEYKDDLFVIRACTTDGYYYTRNIKTNDIYTLYTDSVELVNPLLASLI